MNSTIGPRTIIVGNPRDESNHCKLYHTSSRIRAEVEFHWNLHFFGVLFQIRVFGRSLKTNKNTCGMSWNHQAIFWGGPWFRSSCGSSALRLGSLERPVKGRKRSGTGWWFEKKSCGNSQVKMEVRKIRLNKWCWPLFSILKGIAALDFIWDDPRRPICLFGFYITKQKF